LKQLLLNYLYIIYLQEIMLKCEHQMNVLFNISNYQIPYFCSV